MDKHNLDIFNEEYWDDEITINDIYDKIYGILMSYYPIEYLNFRLVKKNDIKVYEKTDNIDIQNIVFIVEINNNIDFIFNNEKYTINITDDNVRNEWNIYKTIRKILDKYNKEKYE